MMRVLYGALIQSAACGKKNFRKIHTTTIKWINGQSGKDHRVIQKTWVWRKHESENQGERDRDK